MCSITSDIVINLISDLVTNCDSAMSNLIISDITNREITISKIIDITVSEINICNITMSDTLLVTLLQVTLYYCIKIKYARIINKHKL